MNQQEFTELVNKAKSGDASARSELYERTQSQVYFFALSLLHNKESAEDIMQDTFITVLDKIGTLQDPAAYKSWVNQIALNKIRRLSGKKKEILLDEDEEGFKFENVKEEDELYIPEGNLDNAETRRMIMDLINCLPEAQRSSIIMYYYEQMPISHIAEAMGCSEGTVKSRLNYARKEIKAGVEGYEKKGIKLYSFGSVPMLVILLDMLAKENALSPEKVHAIFESIISATQAAAGTVATVPSVGQTETNISSPSTASGSSGAAGNSVQNGQTSAAGQSNGANINAQQGNVSVDHSFSSHVSKQSQWNAETVKSTTKKIARKITSASVKTKIVAGIVTTAVVIGGVATIIIYGSPSEKSSISKTATFQKMNQKDSSNSDTSSAENCAGITNLTIKVNDVDIKLDDPASKIKDCGLEISSYSECGKFRGAKDYNVTTTDHKHAYFNFIINLSKEPQVPSDIESGTIVGIVTFLEKEDDPVPVTFSNGLKIDSTINDFQKKYGTGNCLEDKENSWYQDSTRNISLSLFKNGDEIKEVEYRYNDQP